MPVVMTPFASIGEADQVVYAASDARTFKYCIETALLECDELLTQRRIAIARKANWSSRAAELMDFVAQYQPDNEYVEANLVYHD
jgi:hypothetical protein